MEGMTIRVRRKDAIIETEDLDTAFRGWNGVREHWLFISPHDDDIVVGGGLLLQLARAENLPVTVLIATDGCMGYCDLADRDRIAEIRKNETLRSFELVSIDDVHWLGFSDNDLYRYAGRRRAMKGDPGVVEGHTGLQNALTHAIRRISPTRIFVPGQTDYHPDHKLIYQEVLISVFHARGEIWPELGPPLSFLPAVYEMAIYCPFERLPTIRISAGPEHLARKLDCIREYASQRQIESIIEKQEHGGPVEYLRDLEYELYTPEMYSDLFGM